ncbi:hypothetical protein [Rossellomorea sp. BNER]
MRNSLSSTILSPLSSITAIEDNGFYCFTLPKYDNKLIFLA